MIHWHHIDAIASRIQKRLEALYVTDESRVSLNLVRDEVHKARAAYLGELQRQRFNIPDQYYQRVCCLEVKCKPLVCDGDEVPGGLKVALPALIGKTGKRSLRYLGTTDGKISFRWAAAMEDYSRHFPFSGKPSPFFYLIGSDVFLMNSPTTNLAYLCAEGLFSDPYDPLIDRCAARDKYPICGDDLSLIEDMVVKSLSIGFQRRPDLANDAITEAQ